MKQISAEQNKVSAEKLNIFKKHVWDFYAAHKRDFAWRTTSNPYHIVVSEVMLQQTQTFRVAPKFDAFVGALPTFEALADASLHDVFTLWQGLGYNRRARSLQQLAQQVVHNYAGILPDSPEKLVMFPGIGPATASSIAAFAFNKPTVFIETNIRAVFIHHFFYDAVSVHDRDILPLVQQTVDEHRPREWYYALMDYGVMLKKIAKNPSRKSKHHVVQSAFNGSDRQIRGLIIKLLVVHRSLERENMEALVVHELDCALARVQEQLEALCNEGLVIYQNTFYSIA